MLLRLVDDDELTALLPTAVGRSLLDAAYVFDNLAVGDVSAVSARTISLTPVLAPDLPLAVTARIVGGTQEWQLLGTWQPVPAPAVHAVLDVAVTAATRGVRTDVVSVEAEQLVALPSQVDAAADFDAAVDAIAGHLTTTPRDAVAEVLHRRGLTDLAGLRAAFEPSHDASRLVLTLVSDATGPEIEATYRLTVLVQAVEDLASGLLDAVTKIATARTAMDVLADPPVPPAGATVRESRPALLLFPVSALDDSDLPFAAGQDPVTDAERQAGRLTELTSRLRSTGIVPVAI